jgi:hypothetical protein
MFGDNALIKEIDEMIEEFVFISRINIEQVMKNPI